MSSHFRALLTAAFYISLLSVHSEAAGQTHNLTPSILQQAGALIEPVSSQQILCILQLDDTASATWLLIGPKGHTRQLGNGLAQLPQVKYLATSPDRAWLAVLSESGKQRVLEIVDLHALLKNGRYIVLQQISPQQGTVRIRSWAGKRLIIASNARLALHAPSQHTTQPEHLFPKLHYFAVSIETGHIEEVHLHSHHR